MKKKTIIHGICIAVIFASVIGMGIMLPGTIEKFSPVADADNVVEQNSDKITEYLPEPDF
jgi:hypothetical protein